MKSLLFSAALALFVSNSTAQDKSAVIEPDKAATDPDFSVQGEYSGSVAGMKTGVHVVAEGQGKFGVITYPGGLPGDGWNGEKKNRSRGSGERREGKVHVSAGAHRGVIENGKMVIGGDSLTRVERKSPAAGAKPPAGAVILFDGSGAGAWNGSGMTEDNLLKQGQNGKQSFQSGTLHVEFLLPWKPAARGQERGNSGVYLQSRYEVQVLDSFGLEGEHNECGGIYSVKAPDVNMCFPPLQWQSYDIEFTAAAYDAKGMKSAPAKMTVTHNGTVIHRSVDVPKSTTAAPLGEGPVPGPLHLQDHGNPVRYRNIWFVEKK